VGRIMSAAQIVEADRRVGEALREREEQLARMRRVREEYDALAHTLKALPERVSHKLMVPFGKMAFFEGSLRHTNEVTVLLGENIFAKRSASQAIGIAQRRGEFVQTQISALTSEIADLKSQRDKFRAMHALGLGARATDGVSADEHGDVSGLTTNPDGTVEIREEYDEEEWSQLESSGGSKVASLHSNEKGKREKVPGKTADCARASSTGGATSPSGCHQAHRAPRHSLNKGKPHGATEAFTQEVVERIVDHATPVVPPSPIPQPSAMLKELGMPGSAPIVGSAPSQGEDSKRVSRFKASRREVTQSGTPL